MSSRRVLGFSAEHALSLLSSPTYGYHGPSLQRLRPVLLSGAQRCTSLWGQESQSSRLLFTCAYGYNGASLQKGLRPVLVSGAQRCAFLWNQEGQSSRAIHSRSIQTYHSRSIQTYHSRGIHTSSRHSQIVKLSPSPEVTSPSTNTTMTADTVEDDLAIPLSQQFRDLMRLLTQSVVVCTSTHLPHPSTPSQDPTHRAMTMSSFTSLSLRPTPAISFNIATPSRTLDAIKSSRHFNIHVLSADSSGAKVADWCRQGNEGALQLFQRLREDCQCEVTTDGPAMLQGPGVLHVLRCRLLDEEHHGGLVKVRDHFIVVGEVLEIVDGRGQGDVEDVERRFGLSYADTQYREHGRSIPL